MEHRGWSTLAMIRRHAHVTDTLRAGVAEQINGYFWKVE